MARGPAPAATPFGAILSSPSPRFRALRQPSVGPALAVQAVAVPKQVAPVPEECRSSNSSFAATPDDRRFAAMFRKESCQCSASAWQVWRLAWAATSPSLPGINSIRHQSEDEVE